MRYEGWKVGQTIQLLRKGKGMTAEQLSGKVGVSASHLSQIEQGRRKMSINLMYKLMDALDVDANTLLAIVTVGNGTSAIDDEMKVLSTIQQDFLKKVFLQMIRTIPG